jgi:5-methylcytosine-specific restriction endonuclease McrA
MTRRELSMSPSALLREQERQRKVAEARRRRVREKQRPRRQAKRQQELAESVATATVRAACVERAKGRCEACGMLTTAPHMDHFHGRAREESIESCWMLCPSCHLDKTENRPSRRTWLLRFRSHCHQKSYGEQITKCDAAIALEDAQHPETRT